MKSSNYIITQVNLLKLISLQHPLPRRMGFIVRIEFKHNHVHGEYFMEQARVFWVWCEKIPPVDRISPAGLTLVHSVRLKQR